MKVRKREGYIISNRNQVQGRFNVYENEDETVVRNHDL